MWHAQRCRAAQTGFHCQSESARLPVQQPTYAPVVGTVGTSVTCRGQVLAGPWLLCFSKIAYLALRASDSHTTALDLCQSYEIISSDLTRAHTANWGL